VDANGKGCDAYYPLANGGRGLDCDGAAATNGDFIAKTMCCACKASPAKEAGDYRFGTGEHKYELIFNWNNLPNQIGLDTVTFQESKTGFSFQWRSPAYTLTVVNPCET
jgi:hypothetical protein